MRKIITKIPIFLTVIYFYFQDAQGILRYAQMTDSLQESWKEIGAKLARTFYRHAQQKGNVLFSPYAIVNSLMSLEMMTNETSRSEIRNALGSFKEEFKYDELVDTFGFLINVTEAPRESMIKIINGIFVLNDTELNSSCVELITSYYKGIITKVPFADDPIRATAIINEHMSQLTENIIPSLYHRTLSSDTQIILTPSILFNALWTANFHPNETKQELFYSSNGKVNVSMMTKKSFFAHGILPSLRAEGLQIRYFGNDNVLNIILPYANQTLENMLKSFNNKTFVEMETSVEFKDVIIKIPVMKLKWSCDIEQYLESLGIHQIFSYSSNFENFITNIQTRVSKITHAVELNIYEKETGNGLLLGKKHEKIPDYEQEVPLEFYVKRPFLFYIRNVASKAIVLIGCITNPLAD